MNDLVILSRIDEERLVRAMEAGIDVHLLRQFFTWCQGALHSLLPHEVIVCLLLDEDDRVLHTECLNSRPMGQTEIHRLAHAQDALVHKLLRLCRGSGRVGLRINTSPSDTSARADGHRLHQDVRHVEQEMLTLGLSDALAQGSERLHGGSTFFALFQMQGGPTHRHEYFLCLLLPHLHLALLRVIGRRERPAAAQHEANAERALSARQLEVLRYATLGKTNIEIGMILDLSALTVKNHLQKIYRKLNVHNRVQALARATELKLMEPSGQAKPAKKVAPRKAGAALA